LDNNQYSFKHHSYECIVAAGAKKILLPEDGAAFEMLRRFSSEHQDWMFGHFSYDLKNELEQLESSHPDGIGFPALFFFIPEVLIFLNETTVSIRSETLAPDIIFRQIMEASAPVSADPVSVDFRGRYSKEEYLQTVRELQKHILRGDCYEINFCQEFYAESTSLDPCQVYLSLNQVSPNPFAAYYKIRDKYLLCASPERYLRKEGDTLISQPIKGTWNRNLEDPLEDERNRLLLLESSKERAENVMIVDLVRNDLSRVCEEGSVEVSELFGIYSFPQVHQMISTVTGRLKKDIHWADAVKAGFPVGSMTGAPKKRVMELIEQYERTKRGIFSGAVGYVTPWGDFDFNVVIRSLLYNDTGKYLSYQVGSGITFYCHPEREYEECLLKAAAIKKVLI
jgi:para-aminobenzoate synthetase component 1